MCSGLQNTYTDIIFFLVIHVQKPDNFKNRMTSWRVWRGMLSQNKVGMLSWSHRCTYFGSEYRVNYHAGIEHKMLP